MLPVRPSQVDICRSGQLLRIVEAGKDDMTEGSVGTVNYQDFHRLTEIREHTVTLLIKCPPVKRDSISVNIDTGRVSRHVPVEARIALLMNALAATNDGGMLGREPDARFA